MLGVKVQRGAAGAADEDMPQAQAAAHSTADSRPQQAAAAGPGSAGDGTPNDVHQQANGDVKVRTVHMMCYGSRPTTGTGCCAMLTCRCTELGYAAVSLDGSSCGSSCSSSCSSSCGRSRSSSSSRVAPCMCVRAGIV